MTPTTRRALLAMPMLIPALARAQTAPEQREVELLGVRDPQLGMQLAVASHFGMFREEGLDVTIRWQSSGGEVMTIMGGGFPIGIGSQFGQIGLAAQNIPVKIICGFADIADTQGVVLAPHTRLSHPRELEGKRCAFTQGNNSPLMLKKLGQRFGFDETKIRMINMNPSEGVVAAARGDVDILLAWQPFLHRLTTLGGTLYVVGSKLLFTDPVTILPEAEKLLFSHSVMMATEEWIRTKPNTLKAMLRALIKADNLFKTDRPRAFGAVQEVLRIPAEPLQVMTEANKYGVLIDQPLVNSYDFTVEWALDIRRIPTRLTAASGISTTLLSQVDPARVTWRPQA
ncbi:ABC transporter substrate-binding protein [Plastoroseomonas arctica]|uniref:ABC transporter substrate-binding protein n=1 Tax=Plastoroseomonas arctica TaxID=1509237 RepID=A0AAF1JUD6_9PROT|nr:ABC transporter substrate-binding protein [Plastoroseomonas arctica]MBR0653601.1 ABC transporter substrate-binding protein [Plastoroseomonas arctica]